MLNAGGGRWTQEEEEEEGDFQENTKIKYDKMYHSFPVN